MVASKARKDARKRQLQQAKRDEDRKKAEKEIFGAYEDAEPNADTMLEDKTKAEVPPKGVSAYKSKPKNEKKAKERSATKESKKKELADGEDAPESSKAARFIVFVGSLPYTATNELIAKHFAKLEPSSIRHATSKDSGKSRGFAFLEFDRFERMKDCLRLYHHSMFDDGLGGEPRRINIELTAGGGGGKSKERKDRIRKKNEKLADERTRRAKASKEKGKEQGKASQGKDGVNEVAASSTQENFDRSIHPSRLARMAR